MSAVLTELQKLPFDRKLRVTGTKAWICCPIHGGGRERTPSVIVNLENDGTYKQGDFSCFGCEEFRGHWPKLAQQFGLKDLGIGDGGLGSEVSDPVNSDMLHHFFGSDSEDDDKDQYTRSPWDENKRWRNIDGAIIKKIGGEMVFKANDKFSRLALPVNVWGDKVGEIYCMLNPKKDLDGRSPLKYINSPGTWSKNAVFPFDHVRKMLRKFPHLVVVEGPRDSLNLIQYGVPAVCLMGSATKWNEGKRDTILSLNPKSIWLGFDGDEAGYKATRKAVRDLRDLLPPRIIKLGEGNDPGKLSQKKVEKLWKILESRRQL
jgi:5S rRNA maturation endonuclease (ribonuclease M5)